MTESKFHVGDLVVFPEKHGKTRYDRLHALLSRKLAGSVGTVVAVQKHDIEIVGITEEECQVEFDVQGNYTKWWVIPEWIEPAVYQLSDSDELNDFFEKIGG